MDIFNFYFLNTDFSFVIDNMLMKLWEYLHNIHFEGNVSHFLDLGPGFIFMR